MSARGGLNAQGSCAHLQSGTCVEGGKLSREGRIPVVTGLLQSSCLRLPHYANLHHSTSLQWGVVQGFLPPVSGLGLYVDIHIYMHIATQNSSGYRFLTQRAFPRPAPPKNLVAEQASTYALSCKLPEKDGPSGCVCRAGSTGSCRPCTQLPPGASRRHAGGARAQRPS